MTSEGSVILLVYGTGGPGVAATATAIGSVAAIVVVVVIVMALLLAPEFMTAGRHRHGLRFGSVIATLGARKHLILLVLDAFAPNMILTETNFASKTAVLAVTVAALALEVFCLYDLTTGLVLKLVILTQEVETEAAQEYSATVVPDASLTLNADGVAADAGASVRLEALPAVAHPGLTKITDSANHLHPGGVLAWMLDDAVAAAHHALLLPTLGTGRQALHRLAEIAESPVLLPALAAITLHVEVCRKVDNGPLVLFSIDVFLARLLLLGLLPGPRLLLGHPLSLVEVNQAI